ncbi:DUF2793 domain-containing protein [Thalassobius sp. Cn5-15]|uniref:DUF2793 domain-containing protein n=1 Tax=Thalassobius sp. Cn5-15 TaxID=2917763 RepID=UPI001EF37283|nr:DUF2793 domain-containing protein [Thalassobius sp. Cn5-15]MCG7492459.1 DUF2793 domain-containing protein [Thalassobius sp. Cn5-15]
MTINPDSTFLDANSNGAPGNAAAGTYGPMRLRNVFAALRSTQVLNDITLSTPPASSPEGASYLVAPAGTGDWAGRDNQIATHINGAWVFSPPQAGVAYGLATTGGIYSWNGSAMSQVGGADLNALHDGIADATAAEITALTTDETVLVELANGALRQVKIGDLPSAGADLNALHDGIADATAAEITALTTDETVLVELANGALRQVKIGDLPSAGGGSGGVGPYTAGQSSGSWRASLSARNTDNNNRTITFPGGPTADGYWIYSRSDRIGSLDIARPGGDIQGNAGGTQLNVGAAWIAV